jgi:hypothetical protein
VRLSLPKLVLLQGNLILKILRGKYPPLTGYSKELTDIVKGCLTLVSLLSWYQHVLPILTPMNKWCLNDFTAGSAHSCAASSQVGCAMLLFASQDPNKRPGTNTLLALKSVRQHAKDLGIKLPPLPPSKQASWQLIPDVISEAGTHIAYRIQAVC